MTSYSEQFALRKAAQAEVMQEKVNPQPFDVEDYRDDLERRRKALMDMERQYHSKWVGSGRVSDFNDAQRCMNKAQGIEIALSLLPLVEVSDV